MKINLNTLIKCILFCLIVNLVKAQTNKNIQPTLNQTEISNFILGEWVLDNKAIINGERNKTKTIYTFNKDQTVTIDVDGNVVKGDFIISGNNIVMNLPQKNPKLSYQHTKVILTMNAEKMDWYYLMMGKKEYETLYKKGTRAYLSTMH